MTPSTILIAAAQAALADANLPLLRTHLNERQAFKAVFVRRLALSELDPTQVNGLSEALRNAERLADELVDVLSPQAAQGAAA